jgi:hypothetical protein
MGLERHDAGFGDTRGAIRLLPELVDALPLIPLAPLTGQDSGWRPSEIASPAMRLNVAIHPRVSSLQVIRPAGGAWQGVDPRTGSTASLVWMAHAVAQDAMMFIEIDGHAIS